MTITETGGSGPATKIAKVTSEIFAPWVVLVLLSVSVPWRATNYRIFPTLLWGLDIALFCAVIPMAFIVRGARRGDWDGHHVRNREGRAKPLIVAFASTAAGLALMVFGHAPRALLLMGIAMLISLVVTFVITFWWKVSLHAAVSAGGVATLTAVYSSSWWLLLLLVVAVIGWARVTLRDHTTAQVVTGALLGFLLTSVVFLWA